MKKILMIDDERYILDFFALTISDRFENCIFYGANNGNAGLEITQTKKPDLIIVEIELATVPQGADLLRSLKLVMPEAHMVVFTRCTKVKMKVSARCCGIYDYIEKLDGVEDVLAVIQEVVVN